MQVSMSVTALRAAVALINEAPVGRVSIDWLEDYAAKPKYHECLHEQCDPLIGMYRSACGIYSNVLKEYCGQCGGRVVHDTFICWTEDPSAYPIGKICGDKAVTRTKLYGQLWCVWGR